MSSSYAGDPANYPATITILDGADPRNDPATWAIAYEELADRTAFLEAKEGGSAAFNFPTSIRLPSVNVIVSMQGAASGGLPLLCAFSATTKITHRVYTESGRSESDADSTGGLGPMAAGLFAAAPELVRANASSGTMRKSADFGMTWTSAGSATGIVTALHYFTLADKWLTINNTPAFQYSADLATWSAASGTPPIGGTHRIRSNATAAIAVHGSSTTQFSRTVNGTAWTVAQSLDATTRDWTGVAYNESLETWMAVSLVGVAAKSTNDGVTWSAITVPTGARDVIAFGRYFMALCTDVHGVTGLTSIAVSKDSGATWNEFAIDHDTTASVYRLLLLVDGRIAVFGAGAVDGRVIYSERFPTMPVP